MGVFELPGLTTLRHLSLSRAGRSLRSARFSNTPTGLARPESRLLGLLLLQAPVVDRFNVEAPVTANVKCWNLMLL